MAVEDSRVEQINRVRRELLTVPERWHERCPHLDRQTVQILDQMIRETLDEVGWSEPANHERNPEA
jgi:hypothetical protein